MEEILYNFLMSFSTIILVLLIAALLYILSKGADIIVNEAVGLSLHLGVPKIIIGATIISLGTTLPEASVSVLAAIKGNPDLALGNAIGSIIADTGLIIGIAALIGSLPVDQIVVKRQGKIQLWSGILLAVVSLPFLYGDNGKVSQLTGWIFILLLIIYIYISIKWTRNSSSSYSLEAAGTSSLSENELKPGDSNNPTDIREKYQLAVQILQLLTGIVLVIGSSKFLIPAVEITAMRIGIPQSIIAATLVAFGTSLPELVTAITAVKKGHGEIAIGNIVGADILNVLFVIGSAAAVTSGGLVVPIHFYKLQIPTMLIVLFIFRLFSRGENEMISRREGFILLLIYLIYLTLNFTWL